ncbi:MAG TPA: HAD family hydrolase [Luteimonas sp.]
MLSTPAGGEPVYLLDVDNTLLDNDRFSADLDAHLTRALGAEGRARYRRLYQAVREQRGYADYLEPLQQMRRDFEADPDLLQVSGFLLDYPFADRVYPDVLQMLARLRTRGTAVILSDGDIVFQPRKIQRSGLWDAVQGRVLVYVHKEQMLDAVQMAYPARHYVMVDDKPRLLAAIKAALGARVTTVFVRQGHYAIGPDIDDSCPPDFCIARIGELAQLALRRAATTSALNQEIQ